MEGVLLGASVICFGLMIIGLIKPSIVIRWGEIRTRLRAILVYGGLFLGFGLMVTVKSLRELTVVLISICIMVILTGLVKPSLVIRWGEKKTRLRVLMVYGTLIFIFSLIMPSESPEEAVARVERIRVDEQKKIFEKSAAEKEKVDKQIAEEKAKIEKGVQEAKKTREENERKLNEESNYKTTCQKIEYEFIARNPEKYKNKKVVYTGKVAQITESGNENYIRVDVRRISDGYIMNQEFVRWDDTIWVNYKRKEGAGRILEGDIITFFGDFKGIKTYTSTSGKQITIPEVTARYIEL